MRTLFSKPVEFLWDEDTTSPEFQLDRCPQCLVKVFDIETWILIDCGSEVSGISENFFDKLVKKGFQLDKLPVVGISVTGALGRKSKKINKQVYLELQFGDMTLGITCLVIPDLVSDILLGVDWLFDNSVKLDFGARRILIPYKNELKVIPMGSSRKTCRLSVAYSYSYLYGSPSASDLEHLAEDQSEVDNFICRQVNWTANDDIENETESYATKGMEGDDAHVVSEAELFEIVNKQSLLTSDQKQKLDSDVTLNLHL